MTEHGLSLQIAKLHNAHLSQKLTMQFVQSWLDVVPIMVQWLTMNVTQDTKEQVYQFYCVNPMEHGPVLYQAVARSNVMISQKLKMDLLLKRTEIISMEMKHE